MSTPATTDFGVPGGEVIGLEQMEGGSEPGWRAAGRAVLREAPAQLRADPCRSAHQAMALRCAAITLSGSPTHSNPGEATRSDQSPRSVAGSIDGRVPEPPGSVARGLVRIRDPGPPRAYVKRGTHTDPGRTSPPCTRPPHGAAPTGVAWLLKEARAGLYRFIPGICW